MTATHVPLRLRCVALCFCLAPALLSARAQEPAATAEPETDPRRPAAIITQDVPLVSAEVFARLNQYQHVRAASFAGWSPDGKGILIRTRFGNSAQMHRVYEPGGRREQITFFEEPVSGEFIPHAKDGALLLSMAEGGNENHQVYLLDRTTGRATLLTDGESRNLLGPVLENGERMIISSNRRNGRDTDIYQADCRRPDSMQILFETEGQYWVPTDWSQDGSELALIHYVSINESYPALFDVAEKALLPLLLSPSDAKTSFGALAFSPDAKTLYFTSDSQGEFLELASFDRADRTIDWLTGDLSWDVSDVAVDPRTGQLAFTINEDGASRLFIRDDAGQRPIDLPLGIVGSLEFSPDSQHLGFSLARPDAPTDAYSLRLADGEMTRWTYSEVGGLDPSTFVQPTRIRYQSFDDQEIPAYYFAPHQASADEPVPVLINIHGGPESQYRPFFSGLTQFYLNELGIAVVAPNVRGSAGYGKTYLQLDNALLREDSVRDIGALLDWIDRQPELDASRVAVAGGSYGGYMVLASLVHYPDRIRAGIDIVGIANFITFLERTSPYRQDLRRAEYGDERDAEQRAFFERINPTANADKIRSALLVAHGVNDPRVPYFEAQQIAEEVRRTGQPVWTVYADNEGHGFAKKDNSDYLTAVEVLFLQQYLLGSSP